MTDLSHSFVVGKSDQRIRGMFCARNVAVHSWDMSVMDPRAWTDSVCHLLYRWQPDLISQYVLLDGAYQAAEEDVRGDAMDSHTSDAGHVHTDADVSSVVEELRSGHSILRPPVYGHDVVFPVLHPIRSRRRQGLLQHMRRLEC